MRIVVVGAGLAGLTAAELLHNAGCEVTVLEASNRVGGRAFTRSAEFINGQCAEAGAEWVDNVHSRMRGLVDRFGLRMDDNATAWTTIRRWLFRDGALLGPADLARIDSQLGDELDRLEDFFASVAVGIHDPAQPGLHPQAAHFDALSAADIIDQLELGELARLFAARNMQGEFAAEPREVSALFIAQQRALYEAAATPHHEVVAQRIVGGVSGVTAGLASALPAGMIRFGQPVEAITIDETGAHVRSVANTYHADQVVLACSLVPLRSVLFDPPLPQALAAAVHGLGYGRVTKTALQYPERVWPAGYATTTGRAQRVYEPTVGDPAESGILMGYTGGDGGTRLAELTESERMSAIELSQREMYPVLPPPLGGFSQAWSGLPLFGGSYCVYRPGEVTRFWDLLRQPHGCIHFAGEHTATWTGYLEGAVESGETVASRLLANR
ncbi:MAG: NAD(P)/FAD-dependent oxidoreductase [Actinomycetota bacterium]|jgi:monoamine oxidase